MEGRAEQSRRPRNSLDKSFNLYATYLCQEVFANMSDLPLVFPSNISCFSGGSFAEELARRRDLPVPPLPRRGGALARSEDNLTVLHPPDRMPRSSAILTRHSSYTWLQEEGEVEDMAATSFGRKQTNKQRSVEEMPVVPSAYNEGDEQTKYVPSEQFQPVKLSSDEQERLDLSDQTQDTISTKEELPRNMQSEHIHSGMWIISDEQARHELSEQVQFSSTDQQTQHIKCCSEEQIWDGYFEKRVCENSGAIQEDRDVQAVSNESNIKSCSEEQNTNLNEALSSKMSLLKKMEKKSLFGSAIDRLSFRSTRKTDKKNCAEMIQKKEGVNPSDIKNRYDENENETAKKIIDEQTKEPFKNPAVAESHTPALTISSSSTYRQPRPISQLATDLKIFQLSTAKSCDSLSMSRPNIVLPETITEPGPAISVTKTCPPTHTTHWRQKPPPANNYLDSQWKKLSASMISIKHSGQEQLRKESNLAKTYESVTSSNKSLGAASLAVSMQKVAEEEPKMARAMSMNVLDMPRAENKFQIPSNQLMEMNQYQRRVQVSMERLNVPSWYNPPSTPSSSSTITPCTTRWRQATGSTPSSVGWRRNISHSSSPSNTSTLERNSTPLSSQRYKSRFGTLASSTRSPSSSSIISSSSSTSSNPSKPVYLGWRCGDRLDSGPAYLTSPAQRLASSVVLTSAGRKGGVAEGTGTGRTKQESREEGTKDTLDYSDSFFSDKQPPQVKEAWPLIDSERDDSSDNMDDDSGIDRSDDFRQEILNEE